MPDEILNVPLVGMPRDHELVREETHDPARWWTD